MWTWFAHWMGLTDGAGSWYLWWSGIGSDLPIFAGVAVYYIHHTCHVGGCWRFSRRQVEGTSYVACHKHHPHGKAPTHQEILDAHRKANT